MKILHDGPCGRSGDGTWDVEKIQTQRVRYTVQDADVIAGSVLVNVPFDEPFADDKFTADCNVRVVSSSNDGGVLGQLPSYYVNAFSQTKDGLVVSVIAARASDVIEIHVLAFHD